MSDKIRIKGRTLARAQAMELLFQAEATGRPVDEVIAGGEYALSEGPLDSYASKLARATAADLPELDRIIEGASENWSVSRMPAVDRSLLRLSVHELIDEPEVAAAVVIDESVELAHAFGTDDSPRFVNGVLGRICRERGLDVVEEPEAGQDEAISQEVPNEQGCPEGESDNGQA